MKQLRDRLGRFTSEGAKHFGFKKNNKLGKKFKKGHVGYKYWLGKEKDEGFKKKCRERMLGKTGKDALNWKDGITSLNHKIRGNDKYKNWVLNVFQRDNYTCQRCGKRGGKLEAHHKNSFVNILDKHNIKTLKQSLGCKELWDINNGITLCKKHHRKLHQKK